MFLRLAVHLVCRIMILLRLFLKELDCGRCIAIKELFIANISSILGSTF